MISVQEARELIARNATLLEAADMMLKDAAGCMLSEDVIAPYSIPAYPQSGMDGYALRYEDRRWPLLLVGEIPAGSDCEFVLKPGEAARIFTGAAVPEGADTVAIQEKVIVSEGKVIIEDSALTYGANVRPVGSEIERGQKALSAGTILTPAAIGFLAGMGITAVKVHPLPRVSIIVTGNELQMPGNPLAYGQVYEANSFVLHAALKAIGVEQLALYRSEDDPLLLNDILANALESSDVVIITGGVSVGAYDFTSEVFETCGVARIFHKIRQKPGKPLLFGKKDHKLVFGLPGNPASVLTCFYQYVLPALSALSGKPLCLPVREAYISASFKKPAGLTHFLKGYCHGNTVELSGGQESYKLNSFATANCLAEIPEAITDIQAGSKITVHLFS